MKVPASRILFAAALVTMVSAEAAPNADALEKRQLDNFQNGISSIIVAFAGDGEVSDTQDDVAASSEADNNNDNSEAATTPATTETTSSKPTPSSSKEQPESSEEEPTDSGKEDNSDKPSPSDNNSESSSSSSSSTGDKTTTSETSKPSPTGTPCSNEGDKRCPSANSSGYQLCKDGFWLDQTCSGDNVCSDKQGQVSCVSKDQATVSYESCSKKDQKRCDASDSTKYQICDGEFWQTFTCDKSSTCAMDGDNVVCGSLGTGDNGEISYTMHEPSAYVPESAASQVNAVLGTVVAALGVAVAMSFAGF
ncbi:hypothetical protein LPJ78_003493 [Coemansia sp. RSA 989]|nr:hypothetical protein BX667DRAFT_514621 [Coemansia mojavensis]KAJ1743034.1 hypothetical protein LPJ68_001340 [Coemansia sp. RSA 1086]KAJ1751176.1 hypothetical protein LPJ79_002288 [Coemansia sp. RSA 1821]KAJ1864264.1 hypothetical protein LPJ78_003493 [Coemansia sp. RSA 989]KAJ2676293.1 hypothetical protein IWW42_000581 [Coemansia sp. RSA 1085]